MKNDIGSGIAQAVVGLLAMIALGLLTGLFVQLLWNALVPEIFGLPRISFWQAWGLIVLSGLLTGSKVRYEKD
jgi:hypothetical protein